MGPSIGEAAARKPSRGVCRKGMANAPIRRNCRLVLNRAVSCALSRPCGRPHSPAAAAAHRGDQNRCPVRGTPLAPSHGSAPSASSFCCAHTHERAPPNIDQVFERCTYRPVGRLCHRPSGGTPNALTERIIRTSWHQPEAIRRIHRRRHDPDGGGRSTAGHPGRGIRALSPADRGPFRPGGS